MISARDIELRAGARLLLESVSFQVAPGDKIGLVGRNGAGKTTLARVLAAEAQPALEQAVALLPDDGAWHHLGRLYLTLARSR